MSFYIRKENEVFSGLRFGKYQWEEITPETTELLVLAFTTRADAQNYLKKVDGLDLVENFLGVVISNNLEYET